MVLVRLLLLMMLGAAAAFLAGRWIGHFLPARWQAIVAGIGFFAVPLAGYALATVSDRGEEMAPILDIFFALVLGVPAGAGWAIGVGTTYKGQW